MQNAASLCNSRTASVGIVMEEIPVTDTILSVLVELYEAIDDLYLPYTPKARFDETKALARKLARAVRSEASASANSDAGCAATREGISEYERGRIDASKDVAALDVEGEG